MDILIVSLHPLIIYFRGGPTALIFWWSFKYSNESITRALRPTEINDALPIITLSVGAWETLWEPYFMVAKSAVAAVANQWHGSPLSPDFPLSIGLNG